MKRFIYRVKSFELYHDEEGRVIVRREAGLVTPSGNRIAQGFWVMRDEEGEYIDHDQFRADLFKRNGFEDAYLEFAK